MRQTPCQSVRSQVGAFPTGAAVGVDGGAMDPPTQSAVQGVDMCGETWMALLRVGTEPKCIVTVDAGCSGNISHASRTTSYQL